MFWSGLKDRQLGGPFFSTQVSPSMQISVRGLHGSPLKRGSPVSVSSVVLSSVVLSSVVGSVPTVVDVSVVSEVVSSEVVEVGSKVVAGSSVEEDAEDSVSEPTGSSVATPELSVGREPALSVPRLLEPNPEPEPDPEFESDRPGMNRGFKAMQPDEKTMSKNRTDFEVMFENSVREFTDRTVMERIPILSVSYAPSQKSLPHYGFAEESQNITEKKFDIHIPTEEFWGFGDPDTLEQVLSFARNKQIRMENKYMANGLDEYERCHPSRAVIFDVETEDVYAVEITE